MYKKFTQKTTARMHRNIAANHALDKGPGYRVRPPGIPQPAVRPLQLREGARHLQHLEQQRGVLSL